MGKWPLNLPRGFRFIPTDVELINLYLISMITGTYEEEDGLIPEIDQIYKHEPWDLPDFSPIPREFREWFFFTQPYLKHHNGNRKDRATKAGYWKSTGKDREIKSGATVIGVKKTLVFHTGRTPKGKRTCWVIHEYSIILKEFDGTNPGQNAFVLCRLFKREDSETKSKPTLAPDDAEISPALEVQAETHQTNNPFCDAEISDITMFDAECGNDNNKNNNDFVAENQPEVDEMIKALAMFFVPSQEEQDLNPRSPLNLFPISPADSTPITDNSSQALWEQAEKHPNVQCSSAEKAPIGYDDNGSFAYAAKKQVADVPADKVEPGSNMSQEPNGDYLSPLHSRMQAGLGSPCISYPGTNDLNNGHRGYHQYGANEQSPYISLNDLDEWSCNNPSSQKNLAFDDGSCGGSDAKVADAPFELKDGDYELLADFINT